MFIAQTTAVDSQGNSILSILWWLLPLTVAIIWIAWFFLANKGQSNRVRPNNSGPAAKSKGHRKSSASNDSTDAVSMKTETFESSPARTTGKKKKKKEKNKGNRKDKPTVPTSIESGVKAESPSKKASDKSTEAQTPVVQAAIAVSQPVTEPKPSNAIFEPLREVRKERRKSSVDDTTDNDFTKNESRPRENDAFNQIFGGKFERIVPKATIRSVPNRWPVSATPQVKSSETITPKPQRITPPAVPKTITPNVPMEPAPANGLKSFVSKVKSSTDSNSESPPKGVAPFKPEP